MKHDWNEYYEAKEKMSGRAQRILNINSDVTPEDFLIKFPELSNKIIDEYLVNENLKFE